MGKPKASIAANIFEFDDFNHVLELLVNGRFNYAILPSDFTQNAIFEKQGIEFLPIVEHKLVHDTWGISSPAINPKAAIKIQAAYRAKQRRQKEDKEQEQQQQQQQQK